MNATGIQDTLSKHLTFTPLCQSLTSPRHGVIHRHIAHESLRCVRMGIYSSGHATIWSMSAAMPSKWLSLRASPYHRTLHSKFSTTCRQKIDILAMRSCHFCCILRKSARASSKNFSKLQFNTNSMPLCRRRTESLVDAVFCVDSA